MAEFQISGITYKAGKLSAFSQFHVSRRIAPIIPTLIPLYSEAATSDGGIGSNLDKLATLLQPFADGLANLKDEDAEYILNECLGVVTREHNGKFTPVWSKSGKVAMFDDLDLGVMMQIVIEVIKDSLLPFIRGLLTSQRAAGQ